MVKQVTLDMVGTRHEGKGFYAARCYVTIFGRELACVALKAGRKRTILPVDQGPGSWLILEGLPAEKTRLLLAQLEK